MNKLREIIEYKIITINGYEVTPLTILGVVIIVIVAKLLLKTALRLIHQSPFVAKRLDAGRRYALEQFIRYVIYTVAFMLVAQNIGIDLSLLWAGSAALLVGIGLGLQQIFNDLASGVILLVEGEIQVGDIVLIDGFVGKIQKISIRASHVETRDKLTIVVPNSKLITSNVTNWGNEIDSKARFVVKIGVAYGSDVPLVKKILLQVAQDHPKVYEDPSPLVLFADFGNSSLDFELHFYSSEILFIEKLKSDLRYQIDDLFRAADVQIPFPQQDIWFRNLPQPLSIDKT